MNNDEKIIEPQKIAIVILEGLQAWQELNITAFLSSGFGTLPIMGKPYEDKNDKQYLPMCGQPILIYTATKEEMKEIFSKAVTRDIQLSVYNEEMFTTNNDKDNRACIKKYGTDELELVGLGLCGKKNHVDKTLHGYRLHP